MKLPFAPWLPDLPALGNPGMTDAKNVIPAARGYQPFRAINPFTDALTALVPDFDEVDKTDGWLHWLAQDDEQSGITRQALLDAYVRKGDVKKTASLFAAYRASTAPPANSAGSWP